MEVHKHPHHVMHQKKWNEYLLEFFMLFLAVFLGFVAENIREHIAEGRRAKEFAASMIKDLQQDTAWLQRYKTGFEETAEKTDSLMQLLSHAEPKELPSGKLYWYGVFAGRQLSHFVSNDATFQQMESSGSLLYFKDSVARAVQQYDRLYKLLQAHEGTQQELFADVRKVRSQLFNFKYLEVANQLFSSKAPYDRVDSFINTNPPLLSNDKFMFNEFAELVRSRFPRTNILYADTLLKQGAKLISQLRKSYNTNE